MVVIEVHFGIALCLLRMREGIMECKISFDSHFCGDKIHLWVEEGLMFEEKTMKIV